MEIRIWRSFACNNSSDYRLVARFQSATLARDTAAELTAFLAEAAPLNERRPPRRTATTTTATTSFPITATMDALATQYGFDWTGLFVASVYDDAEPIVVTEGATLVVYHPYCLGLGSDLPAYLTARGGRVERGVASAPSVSVLLRLPSNSNNMKDELVVIFAQAMSAEDTRLWALKPPWSKGSQPYATSAETAFFCDDKMLGFYLPIDPERLTDLKDYLRQAGVEDPVIRLCQYEDLPKFRAIGRARCSQCKTRLQYLPMHEHGIETDQLACTQCGGMFDLATFDVLADD